MSIFVRPVREQLEHDRLIRFLLPKYKRKFEVAINPGDEQTSPVKLSGSTLYPDMVIGDGRKVLGLVEIETSESVNNLEAMYQWVPFAKARLAFHLYVPVLAYDGAKRLIDANHARISEIWTYRPTHDGFDLVRMHLDPAAGDLTAALEKAGGKKPPLAPAPAAKKPTEPAHAPAKAAKAKPAPKAKAPVKPAPKPKPAKPAPKAKAKPAAKPKPAAKKAAKAPTKLKKAARKGR